MKILWLTVDRSNRVANHFDDFRESVSKFADVTTLMKSPAGDRGQNMWQLSKRLVSGVFKLDNIVVDHLKSNDYDFIFCDAFFAYMYEDWRRLNIPSAIFIEDIHYEVPKAQVSKAFESGIETIFHRFNFAFHKFHPTARFDFNCIWLPHSIKMSRYESFVEKSIEVLHVGVYPESHYPYRHAAVSALRNKPYFTLIERPKDVQGESKQTKWPVDKDYDNLLQSSKICITGGSKFDAPVQKYVEIPASGSALVSNWFPDLGLLGFIPEVNIVTYFKENVVEVVENLLNDEDEIIRISRNSLDLILSNHTSEIRSMQFINSICDILRKDREFPDVNQCSYQVNFKGNRLNRPAINLSTQSNFPIVKGTDWKSRIKNSK